ncbi:MAG TPA: hypothetical protein PK619_02290 [bacterium]|nr:hypothetical protein [bacterium]HPN81479.1 hypothetical protein [bacterium]HPW39527.1 hypothetical protein [bacterium]
MEAVEEQKKVALRFFTNHEEKGHRLIGNYEGKITFPDNELAEMIETNGWWGALLNVTLYPDPHRPVSNSVFWAQPDYSADPIMVCPNSGLAGQRIIMLIDGHNFLSALEKIHFKNTAVAALEQLTKKYDPRSEIRFYACPETALEAKLLTNEDLAIIAKKFILVERPAKVIATTKTKKLIKDCPVTFQPIGLEYQPGLANWKGQFGKFVVFPNSELEELINNLKLGGRPINVWLEKIINQQNDKKRMIAYPPEKPGQNKKVAVKSDIDHLIIAEIVRQAEAIKSQRKNRPDGLVLISGDSDYEDSLRYLAGIKPYSRRHNRGRLEIISSLPSLSIELRDLANHQRICLRLLEEELT